MVQSKTEKIIRKGIKKSLSTSKIIQELKDNDLSFKRQDMLLEIRKYKAEYIPKRTKLKTGEIKTNFVLPENRKNLTKKQKWFIEVFEPFRKENKLTSSQASLIIRQETVTTHKKANEIKLGKKYWEKYKKVF